MGYSKGNHNVHRTTQCAKENTMYIGQSDPSLISFYLCSCVCGALLFWCFLMLLGNLTTGSHNIKDCRLIWKSCGYERGKDRKTVLLINLIQEYQVLFCIFIFNLLLLTNVCKHAAFTYQGELELNLYKISSRCMAHLSHLLLYIANHYLKR